MERCAVVQRVAFGYPCGTARARESRGTISLTMEPASRCAASLLCWHAEAACDAAQRDAYRQGGVARQRRGI